MDYKIAFLGTAGNNASYQQLRSAAGFILKFNNTQFHIDPGPGALVSAREASINLKENNVIISTHSHLNHSHDINAVINAMTCAGLDKTGALITPYLASQEQFLKHYLNESFLLAPKQEKNFGEVAVKALQTKHKDATTIGLKFTTPDLIISYTSDTAYSKELIPQYKSSDILILNNVYPQVIKRDANNLTTNDTIKILKEIKPSLAIITHFSTKMLEANPLYEARLIQKETEIQSLAAKDGLIINPLSKSITLRQKSLAQY